MKYLSKYKVFESIGIEEYEKSFYLTKKICEFCIKDIKKIINKFEIYDTSISYPSVEGDDSIHSYEFNVNEFNIDGIINNSQNMITDEEIINYMKEDNIDIYEMSVSFGVHLVLNEPSQSSPNLLSESLIFIKEYVIPKLNKYEIYDISIDKFGGDRGIWFIVQYKISNHLDKLGDLLKNINT